MAASYTAERRENSSKDNHWRYLVTWTSDASGDASVAIPKMNGWLVKVVTDPGAAAPTDDYDVTLIDENSIDAAATLLTNRDTANTEQVYPLISGAATPIFLSGTITVTIANAGNAKNGTIALYVSDRL